MPVTRRALAPCLLKTLAAVCLIPTVGCSGSGLFSSEPKKYAGGGPIPEAGEEVPEAKPKKRSRRR
jgi:hypothetical protein